MNSSYEKLDNISDESTTSIVIDETTNNCIKGTGIQLTIDNNICFVCHEEGCSEKLILYQHGCGNYYIHQSCLDKWYKKEGYECIICREKILNEEETYYKSSSTEVNNLTNITDNNQRIVVNNEPSDRSSDQSRYDSIYESSNESSDECCIDNDTCVNCSKFSCFLCIIGGIILFFK